MPQPVMLKKLKVNGSLKTYKAFRTNSQKRCPFHYRGLECKGGKSRDTWSNRQIRPWSIKWSRSKANKVLPRECIGHSKHPLPIHPKGWSWPLHSRVSMGLFFTLVCSFSGWTEQGIAVAFALLQNSVLQGQICLLFQVFLDFLLLHSSPL